MAHSDPLGADALAADVTTLVICWTIVRRDGVALGFTTHDRPLRIAGMDYASAPGMSPSALVSSDDLAIDTMDVEGALDAAAITAADLAAGRYDGAEVLLFMADWQRPEAGRQVLARGTLGTVVSGTGPDAGFTASLRGPTAMLSATAVETYSPECRAALGDRRCRVAMRGRSLRTVVASADETGVALVGVEAAAAERYVWGQLRVLSGVGAGLEREVLAVAAGQLRLDEPLSIAPGERVELLEGCDKRFSTCVTRFGNAANFRGEPHVPGGDVLTRFGGF